MVDPIRRKKLALHLRHLSTGIETNDDFESNVMDDITMGWLPEQYYRAKDAKVDDPIIIPMLELCWGLYDDTRQHKLIGKDKLNENALKIIARCILFLHSNKEYEWPYFDVKFSLRGLVGAIFTFGRSYRVKRKSYLEWQKSGHYDVWPFFRQVDYDEQLFLQPFLNG